jgi:hypothetical protein
MSRWLMLNKELVLDLLVDDLLLGWMMKWELMGTLKAHPIVQKTIGMAEGLSLLSSGWTYGNFTLSGPSFLLQTPLLKFEVDDALVVAEVLEAAEVLVADDFMIVVKALVVHKLPIVDKIVNDILTIDDVLVANDVLIVDNALVAVSIKERRLVSKCFDGMNISRGIYIR